MKYKSNISYFFVILLALLLMLAQVNRALAVAPSATNLSAAETFTEDTPLNLIDIVVTDSDSTTTIATLTLSNPAAGSLSTGSSGAVTASYNAGTGTWTASGLIADVNALLAGVIFTPALNFNNSFTISTSVSDGAGSSVGTKTMTGVAVNDAPTATNLSAAETYTEDTTLNLIDIVASDVDSAGLIATLTLSNPAAGSITTASSGAVMSSYNAGTGVWTATGVTTDVNVLLAGASFVPAANFNSNFTIATNISDGALSVTGSKAVIGTAVNDAPVLDSSKSPALSSIVSGAGAPSGAVGTLVSSLVDFASPAGQVDNVSDPDSGALLGIAITATDSANFTCYYSLNNGATWSPIGAVSSVSARLLAADSDNRIYLQPAGGASGPYASVLTLRAWDRTSGSDGSLADVSFNGGTTAFSTTTDTVSLTVAGANQAPSATNLSAAETYTEDVPLNLVDIVTSDADGGSLTATLTLSNPAAGALSTATSGAVTSTYDAGTGVWSASGAIADINVLLAGVIFTPAADFNSNFTIATSVTDSIAAALTGTKAVTGNPVVDLPSAPQSISASSVSQSQINLTWSAPASAGDSAVAGYKIYRESPTGNGFSVLVADTGSTATAYSDTGLTASTEYNYHVAAISAAGVGASSSDASATTSAAPVSQGSGGPAPTGIPASGAPAPAPIVPPAPLITPVPITTPTPILNPIPVAPGITLITTRNLHFGLRGADVQELQRFLNSKGFTLSAAGAGSPGNETTYFGPRTRRALAKFQAANNISPAAGYFGPITRRFLQSLGIR